LSHLDRWNVVAALCIGLSASAGWAGDEQAKAGGDDAKAQSGVVEGSGTLVLTGSSTYTGGTTITGGAIQAGAGPLGMTIAENGSKEVVSETYGKKIKINEDPKGAIKIERVTRKGSEDVVEKFEAKDAKELEIKLPEGFKIYKEYFGKNNVGAVMIAGGVVQAEAAAVPAFGAVPGPGGVVPPPGFAPPIQGGFVPAPGVGPLPVQGGILQLAPAGVGQVVVTATATVAPNQLEGVNGTMQELSDVMKAFGKADKLKEAAQPAKDEAKKRIGELKRQLADLEKELNAK
jgi:autotransporter-associated beta strand protein